MIKHCKKSGPFNSMRLLPALLLCCLMVFGGTGGVSAQTAVTAASAIPDSPCDANYYESLKSRAWLEAQREITQNQNLIFKPDSVLEYTCFDQSVGVLGSQSGSMFSDKDAAPGSTSTSQALNNLVGKAVSGYIAKNFNHTYLGGRLKSDPQSGGGGGSYNCQVMNEIWNRAKCMNFISADNDGFFTFQNYATSADKRVYPTACGGTVPWAAEIGRASVDAQTPWTEDSVKTFFTSMNECAGSTPVGTGITLSNGTGGQGYEEKFCIPAGCSYSQGNPGTCTKTVSATPTQTP